VSRAAPPAPVEDPGRATRADGPSPVFFFGFLYFFFFDDFYFQ
jgi:hypothetical protein